MVALIIFLSITNSYSQNATAAVKGQKAAVLQSPNFEDAKNLQLGATYVLRNLVFVVDKHEYTRGSESTLNKLYNVMPVDRDMKISIEGHVCCIKNGGDAMDLETKDAKLSVNRAKAVYDYLVSKGIPETRLTYSGFGKTKPIIPEEKNEAEAAINRRVEIRIVSK